jgi:hypothetical protein
MPTTYHQILSQIAVRHGALIGGQVVAVDSSYRTSPLTSAEFGENAATFPFSAYKGALLLAEEALVTTIANYVDKPGRGKVYHAWRRPLLSQTAAISPAAIIPATNSASKQIIGAYGAVRDASNGNELVEHAVDDIQRAKRGIADGWIKTAVYQYAIDGDFIDHTRTTVKIDVCTYDGAAQGTAIDSNSAMLLPDAVGFVLVCGGVGFSQGSVAGADSAHMRYFNDALAVIGAGSRVTPSGEGL